MSLLLTITRAIARRRSLEMPKPIWRSSSAHGTRRARPSRAGIERGPFCSSRSTVSDVLVLDVLETCPHRPLAGQPDRLSAAIVTCYDAEYCRYQHHVGRHMGQRQENR